MRGLLMLLLAPCVAHGESVVATRMIPADSVLQASDMTLVDAVIPGALTDPAAGVGQSARRAIYPGRPVLARDVGTPVLVTRNARVALRYQVGGLVITSEGRALDKGGAGAVIRVMSLASKSVVEGRIDSDGSVIVGSP